VEFLDRMVPTEDADVSKELLKHYKKLGVKVLLSTKVEGIDDSGDKVKVTVSKDGKEEVLETDKVRQAIGFAPRVEGYGLDKAGVELTDRGAIAVDGRGRTNVEPVGFVKVVADAEHNAILGAHLIGPDVTEQLPVLTLAQQWDLSADEVARNIFAHPTLSEAVKEAVHGIAGHMINF